MDNPVLVTVLSGVSVFVLGQIILKLFLEPVIALKTLFGEISGFFLKEQPQIIGASASDETRDKFHRFAALLLAQRNAIPFYFITRLLFGLPSLKSLNSAAMSLNKLGALTQKNAPQVGDKSQYKAIQDAMKNIAKNLKIVTDYTAL
ncbi:hypothetical protein [Vibrio cholerae]|uniref:hypothetical protein n=1 Tax=Vibrio cholerae TaxID=666 RepID=UPI000D354D37|nr:hypothetical protein [Vibrio cholerae]AWB72133.1 hypothetical protein Sa5Y_VCA03031 [Vibrio cholerae]EJK2417340.1 hypothetical protein [Vibrio cholerae]EJL6852602.1 hypothetical protein [Vibrio cholerae]EJL6950408.1 hypothetical protein [Vibrio cholerae]EJL7012932.1 hypothetical protein [Vibrio cholerae]